MSCWSYILPVLHLASLTSCQTCVLLVLHLAVLTSYQSLLLPELHLASLAYCQFYFFLILYCASLASCQSYILLALPHACLIVCFTTICSYVLSVLSLARITSSKLNFLMVLHLTYGCIKWATPEYKNNYSSLILLKFNCNYFFSTNTNKV